MLPRDFCFDSITPCAAAGARADFPDATHPRLAVFQRSADEAPLFDLSRHFIYCALGLKSTNPSR